MSMTRAQLKEVNIFEHIEEKLDYYTKKQLELKEPDGDNKREYEEYLNIEFELQTIKVILEEQAKEKAE